MIIDKWSMYGVKTWPSYGVMNILLTITYAANQVKWWAFPDSNWGPDDYESYALTN